MPGQMRQSIWQGYGPQPLQGQANAALCARSNAYPIETYQTPRLNLSKTYFGIELVPARPGYVAAPRSRFWVVSSVSGVQTTPPNTQAGSDAAHLNFMISGTVGLSNAQVNAGVAPPFVAGANTANSGAALFPNTPVYLDVTVAGQGTGGYILVASLAVTVEWIALELGQ